MDFTPEQKLFYESFQNMSKAEQEKMLQIVFFLSEVYEP